MREKPLSSSITCADRRQTGGIPRGSKKRDSVFADSRSCTLLAALMATRSRRITAALECAETSTEVYFTRQQIPHQAIKLFSSAVVALLAQVPKLRLHIVDDRRESIVNCATLVALSATTMRINNATANYKHRPRTSKERILRSDSLSLSLVVCTLNLCSSISSESRERKMPSRRARFLRGGFKVNRYTRLICHVITIIAYVVTRYRLIMISR